MCRCSRASFSMCTHSSVRRGLAEDGTRFQIPFQAAKKLGPIDLDAEFGPLISSVGRSEFFYGIVGWHGGDKDHNYHGRTAWHLGTNFTRDAVTLNFGWRHKLNEHAIWLASVGHDVHSGDESRSRSSAIAGCSCFTKS